MTFAPEGRCQSNFVGKDKEATVAGNWFFSNRWLVVTITGKSERNMTNSAYVGQITHFSILSLDAGRLVTAADGQTSTYNRK